MSKGLGSSAPLVALLGLFNAEHRRRRLCETWPSGAASALFFAAGLDLAAVLLGAALAFAFDFRTFATLLFAGLALSLALAKASALVLAMACWRLEKS